MRVGMTKPPAAAETRFRNGIRLMPVATCIITVEMIDGLFDELLDEDAEMCRCSAVGVDGVAPAKPSSS